MSTEIRSIDTDQIYNEIHQILAFHAAGVARLAGHRRRRRESPPADDCRRSPSADGDDYAVNRVIHQTRSYIKDLPKRPRLPRLPEIWFR
jgi:hypothetical protein